MFRSLKKDALVSKCYVSHGKLPQFIDPKQPPTTKAPFAAILKQSFTHTVDLVLPEDLYESLWHDVEQKLIPLQYCRVIMPLASLLESDFFNTYIKTGNILMLSEGRPGVDTLYSLKDGMLRLELSKEMFERSGLSGVPIRDGGRKHIKVRYDGFGVAVEINLRLPSMLHGKKGFERIVWAFKNVLNNSVTWLFYDYATQDNGMSICSILPTAKPGSPISQHHPLVRTSLPSTKRSKDIIMPALVANHATSTNLDFEDWATMSHTWLGLVALGSPRILCNDNIDPYLCRYPIPQADTDKKINLVKIQWRGLLPADWVRKLFMELCGFSAKQIPSRADSWFSLSSYGFPTQIIDGHDGYTILQYFDEENSGDRSLISTGLHREKVDTRPTQGFVLWEFSEAYTNRV